MNSIVTSLHRGFYARAPGFVLGTCRQVRRINSIFNRVLRHSIYIPYVTVKMYPLGAMLLREYTVCRQIIAVIEATSCSECSVATPRGYVCCQ